MRLHALPFACAVALCTSSTTLARLDVPQAPGVSREDVQNAITSAQTIQGTKATSIPATGPGAGKCLMTVVPSELVQSGGMVGTPGTCSRIVQCGTSATYVVTQFNIGAGC